MSEEKNVFELLNLREQELIHQISALRGQIEAKENELVYVRKAKEATGISVGVNRQEPPDLRTSHLFKIAPVTKDGALDFFKTLTIKQLVIQAMLAHFRTGGTTSQSLREFILNAYGREIEQESLRPQLHRLKAQGLLLHETGDDKWHLAPNTPALLSASVAGHPDTRAAIYELQKDEPPESDDRLAPGVRELSDDQKYTPGEREILDGNEPTDRSGAPKIKRRKIT
jgi:hypothetical protein